MNLKWVSDRLDDLIAKANVRLSFLTFLNDSLTLGLQTQICCLTSDHRMGAVCHLAEVLSSCMPLCTEGPTLIPKLILTFTDSERRLHPSKVWRANKESFIWKGSYTDM